MSGTSISQTYSFLPTQISGCTYWLDAADSSQMTFNGSKVSQVLDKSGTGNTISQANANFQPTLALDPVYNKTGLFFVRANGTCLTAADTSKYMVNGSIWNSFMVFRYDGTSQSVQTVTRSPVTGRWVRWGGNNVSFYVLNSDIIVGRTNPFGGVYSQIVGSTTQTIYENGTSIGSGNRSSAASNVQEYYNFGGTAANNECMGGYIFEYIIYSGVTLSTNQRQQIEGYLAWKWGLQGNLPSTHPYKNFPPFMNTLALPTTITAPIPGANNALFVPTQISGCQLWLDAADPATVATTGTTVTAWTDKSGAGNNAGIDTNKPSYIPSNRYLETFNNNTAIRLLQAAFTNVSNQVASFFIVYADKQEGANNQGLFSTLDFGLYQLLRCPTYANPYGIRGNMTVDANYTAFKNRLSTTNVLIYFMQYQVNVVGSANYIAAVNANYFFPLSANTQFVSGDIYLGGISSFDTAGSIFSNLRIYEVLAYKNVTLSSSQRQQVEGYLAWKWGLQGNLPANHPYKNSPILGVNYAPAPTLPLQIRSASWIPTQITGCRMWLDSTDTSSFTLSGSTVTAWRDKTGINTTFTIVGSPQYFRSSQLNNKQAVKFNGSSDSLLYSSFTVNQPLTVFCVTVQRAASLAGYSFVLEPSAANSAVILYRDGPILYYYAGSTNRATNPTVSYFANITGIYSAVFNGASSILGFNGTATPTLSPGTIGWVNLYLGRDWSGAWQDQDVGEVLFYNSALSSVQRQQVEGYLAWKWGLVSNLPNNHPYKNFPPSP